MKMMTPATMLTDLEARKAQLVEELEDARAQREDARNRITLIEGEQKQTQRMINAIVGRKAREPKTNKLMDEAS
jgi:hypothetical protein